MTAGSIPPSELDEDAWKPDAESLNALEAEIPKLAALRSFANEACRQPWFTELGEPLEASAEIEREHGAAVAEVLPFEMIGILEQLVDQ